MPEHVIRHSSDVPNAFTRAQLGWEAWLEPLPIDELTERHWAGLVDKGRAPVVGTRRAVLLKPTMPHSAAGIRIDPPVSDPKPTSAAPVATDTAAPEDEPPGIRSTVLSAELTGVP